MKFFLSSLLLVSFLFGSSVDYKIKKGKKALSSKKIQYKKMDRQLSKVAKNIFNAKAEKKTLKSKLQKLEKNIKNNETEYSHLEKKSQLFVSEVRSVGQSIGEKEKKFVELVSKKFSIALALEELKKPSSESIMMQEVYKIYEKKNSADIGILKNDILALEKKKSLLLVKGNRLKKALGSYVAQRDEYKNKKLKQEKLIKVLARDKAIYKKRFNRLKASRRKLERKLAKLKIIKREQVQAKKRKNREAKNKRKQRKKNKSKKRNSSSKIASYRGGKTISPLKGARLIKKFGTYIDPIYNFKIFNKSITLKAPHAGSKVRSILPGKVVFAENSGGMLGQVVIIEHPNGIHTINAKLSRLAPGIHVGKHVSKGTVIGKVEKTLMFEVTKENKHLNPLTLIRL